VGLTQISAIQTKIANVISFLPAGQAGASPVAGFSPQITTGTDGNMAVTNLGGRVTIQTTCGTIDPCDLMAALQALRV
jgi:hypothetical protein